MTSLPTEMIAAECRELADVLDGLSEAQWDRPSLCRGWTVRHVVAHHDVGPATGGH